ncbi:GATA transcription factor 11 [Cajanus cajan]|nr:GATA transcription factor 11 [Cajanus cajan]XP_029127183.1 GATA transcription factor 11 [Cajanus cajan]
MKDCLFFDKNFNGLSDKILDDVLELFDFPLEDVETDAGVDLDWDAEFKLLEEPSLGIFSLAKTGEPTHGKTIPIQNASLNGKDLQQLQTNSPVSVFESSSSPSVGNSNSELPVVPTNHPRGKRGRRQRLSNINLLYYVPVNLTPPDFQRIAVSESDLPTHSAGKLIYIVKKQQRRKDISLPTYKIEMKRSSSQESVATRKCMHCEVTSTPQWREGPMGPKTLCNACGVRYRSGRLFAEYRPAASPTFVASLHSNSHKKVLEIRNRATQESVR